MTPFPSVKCSPRRLGKDWENFLCRSILQVNVWLHTGHFFITYAPWWFAIASHLVGLQRTIQRTIGQLGTSPSVHLLSCSYEYRLRCRCIRCCQTSWAVYPFPKSECDRDSSSGCPVLFSLYQTKWEKSRKTALGVPRAEELKVILFWEGGKVDKKCTSPLSHCHPFLRGGESWEKCTSPLLHNHLLSFRISWVYGFYLIKQMIYITAQVFWTNCYSKVFWNDYFFIYFFFNNDIISF